MNTKSEYLRIKEMPTVLGKEYLSLGANGIHESVLRSYNILRQVKCLLNEGCSNKVILELIDLMEDNPF